VRAEEEIGLSYRETSGRDGVAHCECNVRVLVNALHAFRLQNARIAHDDVPGHWICLLPVDVPASRTSLLRCVWVEDYTDESAAGLEADGEEEDVTYEVEEAQPEHSKEHHKVRVVFRSQRTLFAAP